MSSDDRELHLLMSTSRTQRSESLLRPQTHKMVFWRQSEPTPATTKTRRMRLLWSYAPDWIITIILAGVFFALDAVPGFKRDFSLSDTSLRHPYAVHQRVPDAALYIIAFVAPLVLQGCVNLITIRSWWDFHNATLGLVLGLATTGAFTQITKITVGRPRPDIIDRCQPIPGSVDPTYQLSTIAICTQTDQAILKDGWRSFFSGHSSLSFAGLGFLAYYLAGKLHLFDRRGHAAKAWISLTPLAGASLVAISRSMDYRHHWQDILVGSIVGLVLSYFSYRQYFPSLASSLSHRPYSPRIEREDGSGLSLPMHNDPHSEHHDQSDHTASEGDDVELVDGTVKRSGPIRLSDGWREDDGSDRPHS